MRDRRCRDFHVHLEGALVVPLPLRKKLRQPAISWPAPGRDAMTEFLGAFRRMKAERLSPVEISTIVSESVASLPRRCNPNGADLRIAFRFWANLLGDSDDLACLHDAYFAVAEGLRNARLPANFDLALWASVSRRGGERAVASLSAVLDLCASDGLHIRGIDLAGSESFTPRPFLEFSSQWSTSGGSVAMHAGEMPYEYRSEESIARALDAQVDRIGHCLTRSADIWQEIVRRKILIERCPLSYWRMLPDEYLDHLIVPRTAAHLVVHGSDDPSLLLPTDQSAPVTRMAWPDGDDCAGLLRCALPCAHRSRSRFKVPREGS